MADDIIWWASLCGNSSLDNPFWDKNVTLNSSTPDVTSCFRKTVLIWTCCGLLWLIAPFYLYSLYRKKTINFCPRLISLNTFKQIIGAMMIICVISILVQHIHLMINNKTFITPIDIIATLEISITLLIANTITWYEYQKGIVSSGEMFLFWTLFLIIQSVFLRSIILHLPSEKASIIFYLFYALLILRFICECIADKSASIKHKRKLKSNGLIKEEKIRLVSASERNKCEDWDENENIKPCPVNQLHVVNRVYFVWILPLIIKGWRNPLKFTNLNLLRVSDTCETLLKVFQEQFFVKVPQTYSTVTPRSTTSFSMALTKAVAFPMIYGSLLRILWIIFCFISPILLGLLIEFVADKDRDLWQGVFLAFMLLFTNLLQCIFRNNYIQCDSVAGLRGRSVINAVVFHKMMKLSPCSEKGISPGDLGNLMSVDAQKIQDTPMFLQLLWAVPVMSIISTIFLWFLIGPACLAGLAFMIFIVLFNGVFLTQIARSQQKVQMKEKDLRLNMIQELLNGIKVIKLYAWELIFREKIFNLRKTEIKLLKKSCYVNSVSSVLWLLTPYMVSLVIFTAFVFLSSENILNAKLAFVTISLINVLNMPVLLLTQGIHFVAQAIVSLSRLEAFMDEEEIVRNDSEYVSEMDRVVKIEEASFTWSLKSSPTLKDITIDIKPNTLTAVVGPVGSGKSSLISAILGDMVKFCGNILRNKNYNTALVSQQAWIQNTTLKNNIIFSREFDEDFYIKVIESCALKDDLDLLVAGDETEIGEKGINLSGGQKQRVSIARAVYQDKDVVLLDDPLSAIDVHVGKHIFENVISNEGILRNKTRILVTHNLSNLEKTDNIIVMDKGYIVQQGTFQQLMSVDGKLKEMMNMYNSGEKHHEEFKEVKIRVEKSKEGESVTSVVVKKTPASGELIKKEAAQTGTINWEALVSFFGYAGKFPIISCIILLVLYMIAHVFTSIWLSQWTDLYYIFSKEMARAKSVHGLMYYALLGLLQIVTSFSMAIVIVIGCVKASKSMHNKALEMLIRAPLQYFDTTPLGRITNRLSKDVDGMDTNLQFMIRWWFFVTAPMINTVILIIYSTPLFVVVAIPMLIVFFISQRFYIVAVRQIKRIDNICRSPIYAAFDECIHGICNIRAYEMQDVYIERMHHLINKSQRPWFLQNVCQRFLGMFLETMMAFVVFFAALFAVLDEDISPGLVGLSIGYSLQIALYAQNSVRSATEVENHLVSVERMDEFNYIDQETSWDTYDEWLINNWPNGGNVEFINFECKYRPELENVLNGINLEIAAGERVGIVGRTGSGKSSLVLALFKILESSAGKILIDGIPISLIGLHDLRKNITIIPQDPIIFSFSLRENLDPFNVHSDGEIWEALEAANLENFVKNLEGGLKYFCSKGGASFSIGEKQLVCLARAILRNTKILVLDEATAAVDVITDSFIQKTLKEKFSESTVITIAHRLNTIMDYDKIIVLDSGKVLEYDSPANLLQDEESCFFKMSREAHLV